MSSDDTLVIDSVSVNQFKKRCDAFKSGSTSLNSLKGLITLYSNQSNKNLKCI